MKKIIGIASILMMSLSSCTVTSDLGTTPLFTETIIQVPNSTKDQLFTKTNSWFVENFGNAESVIQYSDKEAGKIMGKYIGNDYYLGVGMYGSKQTVAVDVRDNMVKIKLYDPCNRLEQDLGGNVIPGSFTPVMKLKHFNKIKEQWGPLVKTLEQRLNQNDSW